MRRITTWLLSTVSALVLLFSYHTSTTAAGTTSIAASGEVAANGTAGSDPTTGSGSTDSSGAAVPDPTPTTGSGSGSSATSDPTPATGSGGSSKAETVTGDAVSTRYGPVQVEITVENGTITESVVTQVPWSDRKDQEINSYAVPILNDEAVSAQSSDIDMVSGATYTSEGYVQSLQSAIDQANL